MSGHSKWATTKHKKAIIDSRRAKLFAKLVKKIEVAARLGGPEVDGNPALFDAIQKAKKSSVPNDNIDRAVKRGAGLEAGAADYQTIMYEGYGPNGVAVLIECLTDNRNRAAGDVRLTMTQNQGNMADPGSASWNGDSGAGITDFGASSVGVQLRAGMSGGRRRKGSRSARRMALAQSRSAASSKARGRGLALAMRGGTGNRGGPLGSDSVQIRAGMGN